MGRVASSVDNTVIESFWSTMQRELLDTRTCDTLRQAGPPIFEWIEAWFSPAAGTPASAASPPPSTEPFTPEPLPRQDHRSPTVSREVGQASSCGAVTTVSNVSWPRTRLL